MSDVYASPALAEGYAKWRPAVHPLVIHRMARMIGLRGRFDTALDVGCGAGLSTAALEPVARRSIGIEPVESMLRWARRAATNALVATARAEELPIRNRSVDLVTAAGSLNYVDLHAFFPEARRVLRDGGRVVVYDFGPGRAFRDSDSLDRWFDEFERRYPFPPCPDPSFEDLIAAASPDFRPAEHEDFEVSLSLTPEFYVEYALTETSVADAIAKGEPQSSIRAWCAATLAPVFEGRRRDVVFRGYIRCLQAS